MDKTTLFQTLQQGLHVTVGATATLIETIQDPLKRNETLSELQDTFQQQTEQWAEKGLVTEEEARRLMDSWLAKYKPPTATTNGGSTGATEGGNITYTNAQSEIQDLTEQIIALKAELEQTRESNNP
jgi:polyhydroxyalkanoate synthesis regulator phasin